MECISLKETHQNLLLNVYKRNMEKELKKAFQKAKFEENSNLASNIWQNIIIRNRRIARLKLWTFSLTGLISLSGIIPAWKALLSDLAQSGFYEYLSLIFSNDGSFFHYSKEIMLSIAESIPTMSIIMSLSLVFVLFLSLKHVTKQIINNNQIFSQASPV